MTARFVLVPGSWHGAWHFDEIAHLLRELGHHVEAVELAGMGADRTPLAKVDMATWVRDLVAVLRAESEPAILVGHSRGGFVVSEAAEAAPEAIALSVYLCAIMPANGDTVLDVQGLVPGQNGAPPVAYDRTEDGLGILANEALIARAYSRAGASQRRRARALITPEPVFTAVARASLSHERYGSVPRAYVECLYDEVIPIALQRRMQEREPCARVISLATDHCPAMSAPELLADALDQLTKPN